jgi:hypothetical protein
MESCDTLSAKNEQHMTFCFHVVGNLYQDYMSSTLYLHSTWDLDTYYFFRRGEVDVYKIVVANCVCLNLRVKICEWFSECQFLK